MRTYLIAIGLLGLTALAGCDAASTSAGDVLDDDVLVAALPPAATWTGAQPRRIEGNVSGDPCSDERVVGAGNSYSGIKVENPAPGTYTVGDFMYRIDRTGRGLGFQNAGDGEVRHVVVKGGPNTNVYDYDGSVTRDASLLPPKNGGGNCPEISWFAICYAE